MSRRVKRLTPRGLKAMIMEEAKKLHLETLEQGKEDSEKVDAEEVDAGEFAGSLEKDIVSDIIKSVAHECKNLGVALVGGETAEMPGTYHKNEYDLVGISTGVVEKKNIIDGSSVKKGLNTSS